jgi:hypothetical protein
LQAQLNNTFGTDNSLADGVSLALKKIRESEYVNAEINSDGAFYDNINFF